MQKELKKFKIWWDEEVDVIKMEENGDIDGEEAEKMMNELNGLIDSLYKKGAKGFTF